MTIADLMNSLKEMVNPGSTAIQTAPGQTYGPAVSRLTRTPINFSQTAMPEDQSGDYTLQNGTGSITVNPKSSDIAANYGGNVNSAIKHEIAHSIVMPVTTQAQRTQMANSDPMWQQAAQNLQGIGRGGQMSNEVPAYMAEPDASRYGIPDSLQSLYRKNFVNSLSTVSPTAANQYQRLTGGGQ